MPIIAFNYPGPEVMLIRSDDGHETGVFFKSASGDRVSYFQKFVDDLRCNREPLMQVPLFRCVTDLLRGARDLAKYCTEEDLQHIAVIKDENVRMAVELLFKSALALQKESQFTDNARVRFVVMQFLELKIISGHEPGKDIIVQLFGSASLVALLSASSALDRVEPEALPDRFLYYLRHFMQGDYELADLRNFLVDRVLIPAKIFAESATESAEESLKIMSLTSKIENFLVAMILSDAERKLLDFTAEMKNVEMRLEGKSREREKSLHIDMQDLGFRKQWFVEQIQEYTHGMLEITTQFSRWYDKNQQNAKLAIEGTEVYADVLRRLAQKRAELVIQFLGVDLRFDDDMPLPELIKQSIAFLRERYQGVQLWFIMELREFARGASTFADLLKHLDSIKKSADKENNADMSKVALYVIRILDKEISAIFRKDTVLVHDDTKEMLRQLGGKAANGSSSAAEKIFDVPGNAFAPAVLFGSGLESGIREIVFDCPDGERPVTMRSVTADETGVFFHDAEHLAVGVPYFHRFIEDLRGEKIPLLNKNSFGALEISVGSGRALRYVPNCDELYRRACAFNGVVKNLTVDDVEQVFVIRDDKVRREVRLLLTAALFLKNNPGMDSSDKKFEKHMQKAMVVGNGNATKKVFSLMREEGNRPYSGDSGGEALLGNVTDCTRRMMYVSKLFAHWCDIVAKNAQYEKAQVVVGSEVHHDSDLVRKEYFRIMNILAAKRIEFIRQLGLLWDQELFARQEFYNEGKNIVRWSMLFDMASQPNSKDEGGLSAAQQGVVLAMRKFLHEIDVIQLYKDLDTVAKTIQESLQEGDMKQMYLHLTLSRMMFLLGHEISLLAGMWQEVSQPGVSDDVFLGAARQENIYGVLRQLEKIEQPLQLRAFAEEMKLVAQGGSVLQSPDDASSSDSHV